MPSLCDRAIRAPRNRSANDSARRKAAARTPAADPESSDRNASTSRRLRFSEASSGIAADYPPAKRPVDRKGAERAPKTQETLGALCVRSLAFGDSCLRPRDACRQWRWNLRGTRTTAWVPASRAPAMDCRRKARLSRSMSYAPRCASRWVVRKRALRVRTESVRRITPYATLECARAPRHWRAVPWPRHRFRALEFMRAWRRSE